MIVIVLLGLLVLYVAALPFRSEPVDRVPFFAAQDVTVIAHAGAQGHAPPNTMEAFDAAMELGAHVLEMDLQLSAEGEVVVIHDGTVDATTDGSGRVDSFTVAELKELDAGYHFTDDEGEYPFRGEGVEIPTLREVFERYPDVPMIIEMKTDSGDEIIGAVAELVSEYDRTGTVQVASFEASFLRRFREKKPEVPTNLGVREAGTFYALHFFGLHRWYRPPGEVLQVPERFGVLPVLGGRFVGAAGHLRLDVQAWTINDPDRMVELLELGVDGIITDYPERVLEAAARAGRSVVGQ